MPVEFREDGLTLWPGFHGWTEMTREEALELARVINERFAK